MLDRKKFASLYVTLSHWPVFWISGLACFLSWFLFHFSGKTEENFEFFMFSVGCSLLILGSYLFSAKRAAWIHLPLTAIVLFFACKYAEMPDLFCLVFSALQAFLFYKTKELEAKEAGIAFVLSLMVWSFARRLVWWVDWQNPPMYPVRWFHTIYPIVMMILSFSFANFCLSSRKQLASWDVRQKQWELPLHVIFLTIILFASGRVDFDFHHWSGYVGPVNFMRQGGALLWDTLSFYGFGNVLLAYLVPVASPWQAVYFVNVPFIFAGAVIYYYLLQRLFKGISGQVFAFTLAYLFIFLFPGLLLRGPNAFPMIGPFRFIWVYALLLNIWLAEEKNKSGISPIKNLVIGNCLWVASAFWSAESFIYGTAIWFPFYLLQFFWKNEGITFDKATFRRAAIAMVYPLGVFVGIHVFIYFFYIVKLGHPPDWYGFIEVAQAFRRGFDCILIDPKGAVWVLMFFFVTQIVMLYRGWLSYRRGLLVAIPSFLGNWMVMSYFVGRSHENNAVNVLPIAIFCLILTAHAVRFFDVGTRMEKATFKVVFIPVFVVSCAMCFGTRAQFQFVKDVFKIPNPAEVDARIPLMEEEAAVLMERAEAKTSDSIVQLDRLYPLKRHPRMESPPDPQMWLPVMSEYHYCGGAGPGRIRLYIERYARTLKRGGWLLVRKTGDEMHCLADGVVISEFFTKTKHFESDHWFLDYYEIKPFMLKAEM